jgi:hypothetical protein
MDVPVRRQAAAEPSLVSSPFEGAGKAVELVQRGRMIVDIARLDLDAAEAVHGPFHPTAWHFRHALADARRSWARLRAELGGRAIEAALAEPPATTLTVADGNRPRAVFLTIGGYTFCVQRVAATEIAPVIWRLTRLPSLDDGPYYVCRLQDGWTQCDCASWAYRADAEQGRGDCKHLSALRSLGWI